MNNLHIRKAIKEAGVRHYEVADALEISEATMVKLLRRQLDEKTNSRVLSAIEKARRRKEENQCASQGG